MRRFVLSLTLFLLCIIGKATESSASMSETVHAFADKQLYLTGEQLHINVCSNGLSRVAYVEISDTYHTCCQAMVSLTDGQGWADIPLPAALHSGYYLLSVYTRAQRKMAAEQLSHQLIAIINPTTLSRADNVEYLPFEQPQAVSESDTTYTHRVGDTLLVELPSSAVTSQSYTVSIMREDLKLPATPRLSSGLRKLNTQLATDTIPELEGHIVEAHTAADSAVATEVRLNLIGHDVAIFDGQPQNSGSWHFYTNGIYGRRTSMLTAINAEGGPVAMQYVSPFLGIVPKTLPRLQVYCNETQLKQRVQNAQAEQAISNWYEESYSAIQADDQILSAEPKYSYDLDEYTRFSSVREILTEFVRGIKRETVRAYGDGPERVQLFTFDFEKNTYSDWPALILLDGMPIANADDILAYDARLLRYVRIYPERFSFGNTVCGGIIAFTSRRGMLPNYRLDPANRLVTYSFPQQHPVTILPPCPEASTIYWNPAPSTTQPLRLPIDLQPGRYTLLQQWVDADGLSQHQITTLEIIGDAVSRTDAAGL